MRIGALLTARAQGRLTFPSEGPVLHLRSQIKGECGFLLRLRGPRPPVFPGSDRHRAGSLPGQGPRGSRRGAHLERDLILLASPDLQAWVVPAQLPEPLPIHGEEPTSHHGRPVREEERGVNRGPDGHGLRGQSADTAAPLGRTPRRPDSQPRCQQGARGPLSEAPGLFLPYLPSPS